MPVIDIPEPIVSVTLSPKPVISVVSNPNPAALTTSTLVSDNRVNAANVDASAVAVNVSPNRGPKGDTGAAGTNVSGFTYSQLTPSVLWTVTHNLNRSVSVNVYDSAGTQVFGGVTILDANTITISFSSAFAGTAYVI